MRKLQWLAVAALAAVALTAKADTQLSIATGGTGGVYYPMGGGIAELIKRHIDGYSGVAEVTGASVENVGLISRGGSDLALALADTVHQAYSGTGDFKDRQLPKLRAIASVYPNAVQLVTVEGSGVKSLSDLRGKRVSVGAPGSGTELNARAVLEANGITYDDIDQRRLNFNETADALRDGDIDAGFWSVGPPTSSIMNLASQRDIRIISFSDAEIDNALEKEAVFAPYTLKAGTYEGVDEDVRTIGIPNVLVANADMDEELAYRITKVLFEQVDELIEIHSAANNTTVEFSLTSTPIPFHPGALRYYEETGADVPDDLRP